MEIRTSKRTLTVLVVFFFVFALGVVYLFVRDEVFDLSKSPKVVDSAGDSFKDFSRLCSKDGNSSEIVCKAFIKDEGDVIGEDVIFTCFDLVVYDGVGWVEDNMRLCVDSSSLDWDNPYGNYDKKVPVLIVISDKGPFLGGSELKISSITLMEDAELFSILDSLPEDQGRGSYFSSLIYVKEIQDRIDKGYYITSAIGADTRDILVLYNARIEDISVQEDNIILVFNTMIYGEELNLLVSAEEFFLDDIGAIEGGEVLIDVEGIDTIDKEREFFVSFSFDLKETEVEEYLEQLSESEEEDVLLEGRFKLISLLAK